MHLNNKEILGKWADEGYFLEEYDDHIITVCYKDNGSEEIAAFHQIYATPEKLQGVCERHHARLMAAAEAT